MRALGRPQWLVGIAAYVAIVVLYWPSVHLAPIALDDWGELHDLSRAPFLRVFEYDRFGHLRPIKSVLFWGLAHHPGWLEAWRWALLGVVLASVRLGQLLFTPLVRNAKWALVAATCWAMNPIVAGVLCWLSAANIAIALLGVLTYLWLGERSTLASATQLAASSYLVGATAMLLVAVMSHELAIVAPALWWAYRRNSVDRGPSRHRSMLLAAASSLSVCIWLGLLAVQAPAPIKYRFATHPPEELTLSAPRYLFENLRLWFWLPNRFGVLLADEPSVHIRSSAIGWVVLAAMCALMMWQLHRLRDGALNFAWLWIAAFLVPVANFVPLGNTPVAMHYLYLPGIGLALLLTRLVQRLVDGLRSRGYPRTAVLPALALAALILAWLPEQQKALVTWADVTALYERTIQNYPSNVEARVNLAATYMDSGKHVEAERILTEALALAPDDPLVIANRFKVLAEQGRTDEALAVQDAHPELNAPAMMFTRGRLLLRTARSEEAARAFRQAFEGAVEPEERFAAGYQLAIAHVRAEHYSEAEALIDLLLAEFPGRPELLLGKQLLTQQRRVPSR